MLVFQWSLTRRLQPPHAGISCPGRGAVLTAVPLLVRLWTRASATRTRHRARADTLYRLSTAHAVMPHARAVFG